jgi:hypothetical protein
MASVRDAIVTIRREKTISVTMPIMISIAVVDNFAVLLCNKFLFPTSVLLAIYSIRVIYGKIGLDEGI